jgi:lipopolysaccharide export system protein LptA
MQTRLLLTLLVAAAALSGSPAFAEKADSLKQVIIDADSATSDQVTQTQILVGNVILQQGTLLIKAGRAIIKTDPQGYTYATFYAASGGLATFRQKRDGGDIWDEGEAERIEYNNKVEVVKMFSKAKIATIEQGRKSQEVQGPYLSYDSRKEVYTLENDVSGTTKTGGGRVRIVREPSPQPAAAAPAPAKKP